MNRSLFAVLLLVLSASASAEEFDYSYIQLDYANIDFDDINVDGDGLGLSGSFAINPDWHVFGGYQAAGLDFGIDATTFAAGIGYNTELTPVLDMFARLSYEYIELDAPGAGNFDENGYGFGVGIRFAATPEVELNAGIDYVDYGSGDDDTGFSAGGFYNFSDAFALGLGGSWSDEISTYTLSGRFYFGR